MKKLSDLIEAGMAHTEPGYRSYVSGGPGEVMLCCALGSAGYARCPDDRRTRSDVEEAASGVYSDFCAIPGGALMRKAKRRHPRGLSLPQAVGILNDTMISQGAEDPRPQLVAWLRELDL